MNIHIDHLTDAASEMPLLLSWCHLRALGITYSKTQMARLDYDGLFPRRIRLSGGRIAWDRDEVLSWIADRKAARANMRYANPHH